MKNSFDKKTVDEASRWVLAHENGLEAEQKKAFDEWIAKDPTHEACFIECQSSWTGLDFMQFWTPQASEDPDPNLFIGNERRIFWRWLPYTALAACLALLFGYLYTPSSDSTSSYDVEYHNSDFAGGKRHFLPDGSSFYLKDNSRIEVDFGSDSRNLFLAQGEAIFEVAHDKARPFKVTTTKAQVIALGTIFSVNTDSELCEVYVAEGRVRLDSNTSQESGENKKRNLIPELKAGHKATVDVSSPISAIEPIPFTDAEYSQKTTWKDEIIDLVSAPLSEIIRQFNLRNDQKIRISDNSLQDMRMSVTVSPENQQEFLNLLELTANVSIESDINGLIIISRK
ncbi:FecR family protein [Pelagicoccus albus]|uniref:FecR domain-containing protein n=1 Tax=Pelagicoccus albus TaxID=415222 RepID=A0A7X1E7T7_9BACT|nr:FecR domain-containing protein [Pelagicoccus albus]MBC2606110.1 FecR domain-containing protein [Pelagicoccus albus]